MSCGDTKAALFTRSAHPLPLRPSAATDVVVGRATAQRRRGVYRKEGGETRAEASGGAGAAGLKAAGLGAA